MKFLVEVEAMPEDGKGPISPIDVERHLRDYVFAPMVSMELSLLEDDGDHEQGGADDYRQFQWSPAATVQRLIQTCEVPVYDLTVPAWPHLRPCGAQATGTGVTGRGATIGTCDEHAEDA